LVSGAIQRHGLSRALAGRRLDGTATTIQRNDGADNWTTIGTNIPCRGWADRAQQEVVIAGELRSVVPWLFELPAGTDIESSDRLIVSNRTFEVLAAIDPPEPDAQALVRQIRAVEVN
jgi:hypothetical protein